MRLSPVQGGAIGEPEASRLRSERVFNRVSKQGAFYAPHFGYLWQSDLNLMLAKWGLGHGIVYDMCTRTIREQRDR